MRILESRLLSEEALGFLISTKPSVSPAKLMQVLKGRLQYEIRSVCPCIFRRNYRLESIGSAKREVIEWYVARQSLRHPMADPLIHQRMTRLQIDQPAVDLSKLRYSAHGQFIYNLHLVLEHADPAGECSEAFLQRTVKMIRNVSVKKELLLKGAGIVANHLHLALGCRMLQAPSEVALSFLNNLAYVHGMQPIFKYGYYVGTFGNFDLGALRNSKFVAALKPSGSELPRQAR